MPRSRRPVAYGPEYAQLLLRAHDESRKGDFVLQLESPNASSSLRHKVYAYFNALRKEGSRADLVQMCDSLSMRTAGSALVFFRSEDAWDARALRSALGLERGFADLGSGEAVVAPSSTPLEKLKSIRSKISPKE